MQYAGVPCLFAMIFTVAGERYQKTLSYVLVSPAARLPLFLGRAVPVMVNGLVVATFSLVVGGLIVLAYVVRAVIGPVDLHVGGDKGVVIGTSGIAVKHGKTAEAPVAITTSPCVGLGSGTS